MSNLVDASAILWPASSATYELGAMEVVQAALGLFSSRKRARQEADGQEQPRANQPPVVSALRANAAAVRAEEDLLAAGFQQVFDTSALTAPGGAFPSDHLFRALVQAGTIVDEQVYFKAGGNASVASLASSSSASLASLASSDTAAATPVPLAVLVGAYALGGNGCGHAGITHGGLTAALFDESLGELLVIAKMKGIMHFKYVVTASLEVSYKKPWSPAARAAYVTAHVSEVQGRKIWVEAVIADAPFVLTPGGQAPPEGCTVYATARALFLEPRPDGSSSAALQKAAQAVGADQPLGTSARA